MSNKTFSWELLTTKTKPSVLITKGDKRLYLHSRFDPLKEAEAWANHLIIGAETKEMIILGIGLGYHIEQIIEKYPDLFIHIYEFNFPYFQWLNKNCLLTNLLDKKSIKFHTSENTAILLSELSNQISGSGSNFHVHKPSLELIENKDIRNAIKSFLMKKRTIEDQGNAILSNFSMNIGLKDEEITSYVGKLNGSPAILVSAGPSLTKQLPLLKRASEQGVIIAVVGTALIPLYKNGIKPDIIMVSDPKDGIMEQFTGVEQWDDVPLFYLSSANHHAVRWYKGPRFIVWQKGLKEAEEQAEINNTPLVETGGSVATCLLDLLVTIGAGKIALVGQDLAFTNNQTHADHAHAQKKVAPKPAIEVTDYYQKEKVMTSMNLSIYLKWFESYVMDKARHQFWNCTEGGAHIKGWEHRTLTEFLMKIHGEM